MVAKQSLAIWLQRSLWTVAALCMFYGNETHGGWQPAATGSEQSEWRTVHDPDDSTPSSPEGLGSNWLDSYESRRPLLAEQIQVTNAGFETSELASGSIIELVDEDESELQVRLTSWFGGHTYRPQPLNDQRNCPWTWQLLPPGLIYKSYLAGEKEPRFASAWLYEKDRGVVWDIALGGRVGIFRYGTPGTFRPQGWQLDFEGAVFPRIDPDEHHDLEASDYRVGIPLTWSRGSIAIKAGYFHISSHAGDEFILRTGFNRINYVRDSLVLGIAHYPSNDTRVYFEIGYAPGVSGGAEPLEFQFGAEYSPVGIVCCGGAPFAAINGHLREEVNFGGSVNIEAGWQWRGSVSNRLLRAGFQYFNGKSYMYEFFNTHEELTGFGIWLDY